MIHNLILSPEAISALSTIGAATVTGVFSFLSGNGHGRAKGRKEFIDAVERAAELVITRLESELDRREKLHLECEESRVSQQAQIDLLMASSGVAAYHLNRDGLDDH